MADTAHSQQVPTSTNPSPAPANAAADPTPTPRASEPPMELHAADFPPERPAATPPPLPEKGRLEKVMETVKTVFLFPANALHAFVWGNHLLTDSVRFWIATAMWLIVLGPGVLEGAVNATGLSMSIFAPVAIGIATIMSALSVLLERSMITQNRDQAAFPRLLTRWARIKNSIGTALRVAGTLALVEFGASVTVVVLNHREVQQELDKQKAALERQVREERLAEIRASYEERIARYRAQRQTAEEALRSNENNARIDRNRSVEGADNLAAREAAEGAVSGRGGGARGATTNLRVLAQQARMGADAEHQRGQTRIQNAARETQSGITALEREREMQIERARRMKIEQLARESGVSLTVPNGLIARFEANQAYEARHELARLRNRLVHLIMLFFSCMGVIASLFSDRFFGNYFSTKAHAAAKDGTPESEKAMEIWLASLATDPTVAKFLDEYKAACHRLIEACDLASTQLRELATRDANGAYRTYAECMGAAAQIWKPVHTAQLALAELDHEAALALMDRPAWPFGNAYVDLRGFAFQQAFSLEFLTGFGWQDPTQLVAIEANLREQATNLNQTVDQLEAEHSDFVAGRSGPTDDTQRIWHTQLRDRVASINEQLCHYERVNGSPFAWSTGENPLFRARRFAMPPVRVNPSTTVSQPPAPSTTTDQSGVHSLLALTGTDD